jgi:hypothetical protein
VSDRIITALADPHRDRRGENAAAAADDIVIDYVFAGELGRVGGDPGFTDSHPAGPEVLNQVMFYLGESGSGCAPEKRSDDRRFQGRAGRTAGEASSQTCRSGTGPVIPRGMRWFVAAV